MQYRNTFVFLMFRPVRLFWDILGVPRERIVPRMVGNSHVVLVCFAGKQLPLTGGLPHPLG